MVAALTTADTNSVTADTNGATGGGEKTDIFFPKMRKIGEKVG